MKQTDKDNLIKSIKEQWVEDFGDLTSEREIDGYTLIGFILNILNKDEINKNT